MCCGGSSESGIQCVEDKTARVNTFLASQANRVALAPERWGESGTAWEADWIRQAIDITHQAIHQHIVLPAEPANDDMRHLHASSYVDKAVCQEVVEAASGCIFAQSQHDGRAWATCVGLSDLDSTPAIA